MENNKMMQIDILTPKGLIYSEKVQRITSETIDNRLTILPNHIPILAVLDIGVIEVTDTNEDNRYIAINGGNLEFHDNHCSIVATFAIRAKDIDEGRVEIKKQQAEANASQALDRKDTVAYQRAQLEIRRSLNLLDTSDRRGTL